MSRGVDRTTCPAVFPSIFFFCRFSPEALRYKFASSCHVCDNDDCVVVECHIDDDMMLEKCGHVISVCDDTVAS